MNFFSVSANCFANKILKFPPILGSVARIDDVALELNERRLVGAEARSSLKGGDEPIGPACAGGFALDGEGGSRFFRIEVVDGAGESDWIIGFDQRARLGIDVHAHLLDKASGPAHRRTEANPSQQIVDDAMARTVASVGYNMSLGIKRLDVVAHTGILEIQVWPVKVS